MDFGLSREQQMLADSVARLVSELCPLEHVRETVDGGGAVSVQTQAALAELGLAGLLVPEAHGGLGLGLLDAAVVGAALGKAVAPVAFVGRHVMAPLALVEAGSEDQKSRWLPRIASGEAHFGVGVQALVGRREGSGVSFDKGRLSGFTVFVIDADDASHFVVADNAGRLHLVERQSPGVETSMLKTIDATRSVAELHFSATPSEALADDGGAAARRLIAAGRIALAADSVGAADAMIAKALAYAGEREQFGRLIGSFQAVKHMCAEMAARNEPCRSLVWYAAHAFDAVPADAGLLACQAKSHVAEVGVFVARTATEVHGGMGFTDLLGLHYWFKRIGFDRQVLGGPEAVRREAAALQGWFVQPQ
jgi:alkylation response protein AidB-like acyl-CoA dehydrogenase